MELSPFAKQLFVASAPLLASLSVGGAVSYPTVLLHQLKRNDTTIPLDFDTASWIGAIHGLAGIPSILMPAVMQWRGRKFAFIFACLVSILGWVLAYIANSASVLLVSESLHGFSSNTIFAVSFLSISEMIAHPYRDALLQMFFILELAVMAVNGLLIHYLHWKIISLIMCAPMLVAVIVGCMWPESPYWLACKGEYEKCRREFRWLRGTDAHSESELQELINTQKRSNARDQVKHSSSVRYYLYKIKRRDFYVPATHMFILQFVVYGMGSVAMIIYSVELFQKASDNTNVAFYGSMVVNGIQLTGVAITIIISRHFNKKSILLASTFVAALSLICASAVSYLQTIGFVSKESLISLYFIVAYFISLSLGVIPIAYCIASEVMPVKHRGIGGILYITNTCVFHTVSLKFAPYLFVLINLHGTFLIFAANGVLAGLVIWKFVPDTQGKTLQQIENYYTRGGFDQGRFCRSEKRTEEMMLPSA